MQSNKNNSDNIKSNTSRTIPEYIIMNKGFENISSSLDYNEETTEEYFSGEPMTPRSNDTPPRDKYQPHESDDIMELVGGAPLTPTAAHTGTPRPTHKVSGKTSRRPDLLARLRSPQSAGSTGSSFSLGNKTNKKQWMAIPIGSREYIGTRNKGGVQYPPHSPDL